MSEQIPGNIDRLDLDKKAIEDEFLELIRSEALDKLNIKIDNYLYDLGFNYNDDIIEVGKNGNTTYQLSENGKEKIKLVIKFIRFKEVLEGGIIKLKNQIKKYLKNITKACKTFNDFIATIPGAKSYWLTTDSLLRKSTVQIIVELQGLEITPFNQLALLNKLNSLSYEIDKKNTLRLEEAIKTLSIKLNINNFKDFDNNSFLKKILEKVEQKESNLDFANNITLNPNKSKTTEVTPTKVNSILEQRHPQKRLSVSKVIVTIATISSIIAAYINLD